MRVVLLAVTVATSATPIAVSAQRIGRAEPAGVMDFRADWVAFGPAFVSPSEEGLVSLTFDERIPIAGFQLRDPRVTREVFRPDDVIDWVTSIESALSQARSELSAVSTTHTFMLGRERGVRIFVDLTMSAGDRRIRFGVNRCGTGETPVRVGLDTVMTNLAAFRRAAIEAKRLTLQTVTPAVVWYEHAVACPAVAAPQNRPPVWPHAVTTLRPHQELVQFVINVDGRVEPTSIRFLPKSDERFTQAIRDALPRWLFTPATRMGHPVRQLAHLNVGFVPPLAIEPNGRPCPEGKLSELGVRATTTTGQSPGGTFLQDVAAAFGYDGVAYALHGAIVRFTHRRDGSVSDPRVTLVRDNPELAALIRNIVRVYSVRRMARLPDDFAADSVDIEVRFPLRCEELFTARLTPGIASVLPRGDGTLRLANEVEGDGSYLIAEPSHRAAVIPATELKHFVESVSSILAALDTNAVRSRDTARTTPRLGVTDGSGLTMSMLMSGTITAATNCPGYGVRPFLRIERGSFGRFREIVDNAIHRMPWQRPWQPRGDAPNVEHELTCYVERNWTENAWVRPYATGQTSREVVMQYVVGPGGGVIPGSVEFMPGLDSLTERLVAENLMTLSFTRPLIGGMPVRAKIHGRYILRPADSDAIALLERHSMNRPAADTLPRTVFARPRARLLAPDRRETWARPGERPVVLEEVRKRTDIALRNCWTAQAQFHSGLKLGDRFMVTVWLHDAMGREEHAYMAVDSIVGPKVYGVLASPMLRLLDWRQGDRYAVIEVNIVDWTIVRADGSVDGNIVAKYLDEYVRYRRRR